MTFFISYNIYNATFKHNKCYSIACKSENVNKNTYLLCEKKKKQRWRIVNTKKIHFDFKNNVSSYYRCMCAKSPSIKNLKIIFEHRHQEAFLFM